MHFSYRICPISVQSANGPVISSLILNILLFELAKLTLKIYSPISVTCLCEPLLMNNVLKVRRHLKRMDPPPFCLYLFCYGRSWSNLKRGWSVIAIISKKNFDTVMLLFNFTPKPESLICSMGLILI